MSLLSNANEKKLCLLKSFNILFNYFPDELAWSKLEFTGNVMLDRGQRYEYILKFPHLEQSQTVFDEVAIVILKNV